jgi:hypothetical protein
MMRKMSQDVKKAHYELVGKDLVYVNDVSEFILHIIRERGLNPAESLVRVGTDGGGGSFKVICNIFDASKVETEKKGHILTGFTNSNTVLPKKSVPPENKFSFYFECHFLTVEAVKLKLELFCLYFQALARPDPF